MTSCQSSSVRISSFSVAILHIGIVWLLVQINVTQTTLTPPSHLANGYKLMPPITHLITAPTTVRADQTYNIHVTIFHVSTKALVVRASIQREDVEHTSVTDTFTQPTSRIMSMKMRDNAEAGNYTLRVVGLNNLEERGVLFSNETKLSFQPKHVSVFIQTDKYLYQKKDTIFFRVLAFTRDTIPVKSSSINIYFRDRTGRTERRWLSAQLNNGVYEGSYKLTHPTMYGDRQIVVEGWGNTYDYWYRLENNYQEILNINTTVAPYVMENEFAISGVITVNATKGTLMKGNASITLKIKPDGVEEINGYVFPEIKKDLGFIEGLGSFIVPLSDIAPYTERLAGTEVEVTTSMTDVWSQQSRSETTSTFIKSKQIYVEFLGGSVRTFKPGITFVAYVSVFMSDGSPIPTTMKRRQVYFSVTERLQSGAIRSVPDQPYIIPEDSIVRFTYLPSIRAQTLTIEVKFASAGGSGQAEYLRAYRHFTHSEQYIHVSTSTEHPRVDKYMVFTVTTTMFIPQIFYEVTSGGNILIANQISMRSMQQTFSLGISRQMVPTAHILVFCVLETGEILTDVLNFHVNGIRGSEIDISVNKGKDFSVNSAEVRVDGDPGAYISYSGCDFIWYSHNGCSFLTKEWLEHDLQEYDHPANQSFSHTWLEDFGQQRTVFYPSSGYAIDANTTFLFTGLVAFTDGELTRQPDALACNDSQGYLPCFDGTCYPMNQGCDGVMQCSDGADEMGCPDLTKKASRPDLYKSLYRLWVHLESSKWLWDSFYSKPDGMSFLSVHVPLRPATWLVQAISLSRDKGLAFTEAPARFDTTRPFYMEVEAPSNVYRGEEVGLQISCFNWWNQYLEILITLEQSDNYKFIRVGDEGVVNSYDPKLTGNTIQSMIYLREGSSRMIHFPVAMVRTGKVTVKLTAETSIQRQVVSKTITVLWEGIKNSYHTPYFVDLVSYGSQLIPDLQIPVPERFVNETSIEHLYIPGSGVAKVSVVGDLIGPGLTNSYMIDRDIFDLIMGDAESYLMELGYNLHLLRYFKTTNQMSKINVAASLEKINSGIAIMYPFTNTNGDGGVSMRRKHSESSVRVSAQFLEVFSLALLSEWEEILYIDTWVMNGVADFLVSKQDQETGMFSDNTIFYEDLTTKENVFNDDGAPLNITLTAFAAIGLKNAVPHLTGEAQSRASSAASLAADYLASNFHKLNTTFDVCLVTYALHVLEDRSRSNALMKMLSLRRSDGFTHYWAPGPIPENYPEYFENIPYLYSRPMPNDIESVGIHSTSLALMSILHHDYPENYTKPVMTWLEVMRTTDYGYAGTGATLAAMNALAMYGERITNRQLYVMSINMRATSTPSWHQEIMLDRGNFNDYQAVYVPNVFGTVRPQAHGTGYALLQLSTDVNVEFPWQVRNSPTRGFDLEVDELSFSGRNSSHMYMRVCMSWVRPDIAPTSGNAIVLIDIPTGFVVLKNTLRAYQRTENIPIKRTRFTKQKVAWYFDHIDGNRNCYEFYGDRWYPVANVTVEHKLRIFDPNNLGFQNISMYQTYDLYHNHICQVCGSFQCPYCPAYNSAPTLQWSQKSLAITMVIIIHTLPYHIGPVIFITSLLLRSNWFDYLCS